MSGSVKLDYFTNRRQFVTSGSLASGDYTSDKLDVRRYRRLAVTAEWSGYNGVNGALQIQYTDKEDPSEDDWAPYGGAETTLQEIEDAAGVQPWVIRWHTPGYIRLVFFVGNGTAGTLNAYWAGGD